MDHILHWAARVQIYALRDPAASPGEGAAAAVLTLPVGSGDTVEIRLVQGAEGWRGHDVELRIVEELADALRARGVRRIVAGVGNAELQPIDLLTRAGFRISYVERDACTPERGWTRVRGDRAHNRDVLWLELEV